MFIYATMTTCTMKRYTYGGKYVLFVVDKRENWSVAEFILHYFTYLVVVVSISQAIESHILQSFKYPFSYG